jgi:mRNA interferase RelE/StbE
MMKISFTKNFNEQLVQMGDKKLAIAVKEAIENIEKATSPWEILALKKLKGHKSAYRIRLGNYRLGLFIEKSEVTFAAIASRKDIYKKFP